MKKANSMPTISKKTAMRFVLLLGFVSLFADITYEGARSISGPYLASLGANATIVGFVAGFGEMLGYILRLFSGYFVDRTSRHWLIIFVGYAINLLAVPLLAIVGHWQLAALLLFLERSGKAFRTPARDVMLSVASEPIGSGWGFGIHKAMDQAGGMIGPLIIAGVLYFQGSYQEGFALLLFPALLTLLILFIAQRVFPSPQLLAENPTQIEQKKLPTTFWLYLTSASLIAAGYADFPLIAYHFEQASILPKTWIPISYALALGVSGISALVFGYLYDRLGFLVLVIITLFSSLFAPCCFLGGFYLALLGMILWGIGMGIQASLMRAIVANMISFKKRGIAYGIFNTVYGISWFLGSFLMGYLYDTSIILLVVFSVTIQLLAIPILIVVYTNNIRASRT